MNSLFPVSDMLGFHVRPANEALGFRVRPQDVVLGFNLDENGLPRQEGSWPDGMQPALMLQYSDPAQTLATQTIRFPTPGSGELTQPAAPALPDWLYELWTMPLPELSGVFDPRTGRRVVPYEPLINLVRSYPTADQNVDGTEDVRADSSGISVLPGLGTVESHTAEQRPTFDTLLRMVDANDRSGAATAQNLDPRPAAREAVWSAGPLPPRDGQPSAQPGAKLQDPQRVEMGRQATSVTPTPSVRPTADPNFILVNASNDGGQQIEQQRPPLQDQQTPRKVPPSPLYAELISWPPHMLAEPSTVRTGLERSPEQEVTQLSQKPTWDQPSRQPSQNATYLSDSGRSSFGQSLVQRSVETVVPGAYYQQLARQEFEAGNYGAAAAYQAAAFADAALGVATFGLSTRLGAAARTAVGEGGALFRRAFESGSQLKRYLGRAPEGMHWHHIVEQSQTPQFSQRAIQSVENVVAVPIEAHQSLNPFYSSKTDFSHPNTVREWLRGQSFEEQYEYGMERLRQVLGY